MELELRKSLKHNLIFNLLDGGFFGFAIGFASFVTILPLFVSSMTDSAILIGLIPAIHSMGWQLPQLLTSNSVSRQQRYKPMVLIMTVQERLPFLGLAVVAWFLPRLNTNTALWITFILLIWQGLGGGLTATAWQSMIGKIIPSDRRGTFFGTQSAASNLLATLSAVFAGFILEKLESPLDFTILFLLASVAMGISWFCLAQTHEPAHPPAPTYPSKREYWQGIFSILRRDQNFCWFLVMRMLSQVAILGFAFYTVYAVRYLVLREVDVGLLTGVYLGAQIAANPLMGWIGDRWSYRTVMEFGLLAAVMSGLVAWWAPSPNWYYLVFILAGIANVAIWTVGISMTMEFGPESDRPAYIGLANTLVAPATILAPAAGGWLADLAGYPSAFLVSVIGGVLTLFILHFRVMDPRRLALQTIAEVQVSAEPEA